MFLKKRNDSPPRKPQWRPAKRKGGELYRSEGTLNGVPGQYRLLCTQVPLSATLADPSLAQVSHFYWCTYRDLPPRRCLGRRRLSPRHQGTLLFGGRLELRAMLLQDAIAWEVMYLLQKQLSACKEPYFLRHRYDRSNSAAIFDYWEANAEVILLNTLSLAGN
jgi:hypothetical protein